MTMDFQSVLLSNRSYLHTVQTVTENVFELTYPTAKQPGAEVIKKILLNSSKNDVSVAHKMFNGEK